MRHVVDTIEQVTGFLLLFFRVYLDEQNMQTVLLKRLVYLEIDVSLLLIHKKTTRID